DPRRTAAIAHGLRARHGEGLVLGRDGRPACIGRRGVAGRDRAPRIGAGGILSSGRRVSAAAAAGERRQDEEHGAGGAKDERGATRDGERQREQGGWGHREARGRKQRSAAGGEYGRRTGPSPA